MPGNDSDEQTVWLAVIGKALAFLCLTKAKELEPAKFEDVLKNVDFLRGLGLPEKDAAEAAGTSVKSVRILRKYHRGKKAKARNGKAKKAGRQG
jgi:hypothetical protein